MHSTHPAAQDVLDLLGWGAAQPPALDQAQALSRLAGLLKDLPVEACNTLGFSFGPAYDTLGQLSIEPGVGPSPLPRGTLVLDDSPARGHRAMLWDAADRAGPDLWIDGHPITLPRDAQGESLADPVGWWVAERFYVLPVALLQHPLQDWSDPFERGVQRGLLIVDAQGRRQWFEQPAPEASWTAPRVSLSESGDELRLYADPQAWRDGRVARTVSLHA